MIGLAVAVLLLAAVAYLLLRNAHRWEHQPPWEPPAEVLAAAERARQVFAKAGVSFAQMSEASKRVGEQLTLASELWLRGLHRPGDLHPELCHLDGKPWPCAERIRLQASVTARRTRLGLQDPETVGPTR